MPISREEMEKQERQRTEEMAKAKERIITILRENPPDFLSQTEIEEKLDKRWFTPLWEKRFLKICVFSFNFARLIVVDKLLNELVTEEKIVRRMGMYGIK